MEDNIQPIDLSGQNNGLLDSSFENLLHHQFLEHEEVTKKFELLEELEAITLGDNFQQSENLPQPSKSLEPERTKKNGKCNLRQSLAWDNAFFTSEGFLEPEELSSMLEGAHSVENEMLHTIEENGVHRSMDSISTMDSDSLTLVSSEADLFQDIRASIQRSSKASREINATNQTGLKEKTSQINQSSRKVAICSQNKVNSKLTSKRSSIDAQGSGKSTKTSSIGRQVSEPIARGRESAPSLPKIPKALDKAFPISVATPKKAYFGANRIKLENNSTNSTVAARLASSSRTPGVSSSRSGLPRPTQSLRFSSTSSLTKNKTETTTSCSSLESVASVSSKNVGQSPSNSIKRNKPPTPSPFPNFVLRNKTQQGKAHRSTHFKSSTKLSSSISPASSISEWSCESLSSTSTSKPQFSNAKANHGSNSPCKTIDNDLTSRNLLFQSNDQFSAGYGIQETEMQSPYVNDAVKGAGTSAKPSGLRIPSPKIGFFDGAKSVLRTPRGSIKADSRVPSSLSKSESGCSYPVGATNIKPRNVQPTSVTPLRRTPSNPEGSSASKTIAKFPAQSPKDQKMKSRTGERGRSKIEEKSVPVQDRAKVVVDLLVVESGNSPDKYKLPNSSNPKEEARACSAMEVSLNILSNLTSLSLSPVTSELLDRTRSPLRVVNSFSGNDRDRLFESSKGSSLDIVDDMDTLIPSAAQKENS